MDSKSWVGEVPVTGQKIIEPDARIVDAFQNIGYNLEAAIADLIDNSIDARADTVLVRFLRTDEELLSLDIVDNGSGMSGNDINRAMKFGGQRHYSRTDLGIYGMGLKAASLSQAENLTVISRAKGDSAVGRRWQAAQAKRGWHCDIVSPEFATEALNMSWNDLRLQYSGTIIRWDKVRDFSKARARVDSYLQAIRKKIDQHLGLQLHRFLDGPSPKLHIQIETLNVQTNQLSPPFKVQPLDPFSYGRSGAKTYPKDFQVDIPEVGHMTCTAHIWPPRTKAVGYKLGGGSVAKRQGFYFYRNERLLQAGGWNNYREDAEPHLSLARVAIDLKPSFQNFFGVRFNKAAIDAPRSFLDALTDAKASDGTTFTQFIDRSILVYRTKGERKLEAVFAPGKGFRAAVVDTVRSTREVLPKHSIDVIWFSLPRDTFFQVDLNNDILFLNNRYRRILLGDKAASAADLPLIKTLLYLLTEQMFHGERQSGLEKKRLDAYQAALIAALNEEQK